MLAGLESEKPLLKMVLVEGMAFNRQGLPEQIDRWLCALIEGVMEARA